MKNHETYSWENAKKIIDALETLNKDFELRRIQEPIEYEDSKHWGKIPKPQRIRYIITEH
jgi:hypothetical protein